MNDTPRPLPVTPPEALGPTLREEVIVEGRTYLLQRPGDSDKLLDHPAVREAFAADEYMPYWADLWPAARMLAKALLREPWPPEATAPATRWHALEVGCGLGLPGVVALSLGFRVTFSDYDATALRFAADNARLNGLSDFDLLPMDWREPPRDRKFRLILASDLIYEMRNVAPLVGLIAALLAPDGECLLTDQDRVPSHVLRDTLTARGLPYTTQVMRAGEPGGRRLKGTLYRIRPAGGPPGR
jgi:predicted nicotinamide N-methyase